MSEAHEKSLYSLLGMTRKYSVLKSVYVHPNSKYGEYEGYTQFAVEAWDETYCRALERDSRKLFAYIERKCIDYMEEHYIEKAFITFYSTLSGLSHDVLLGD